MPLDNLLDNLDPYDRARFEAALRAHQNILLVGRGPLLARAVPHLLPPLSRTDRAEVAAVAEAFGLVAPRLDGGLFGRDWQGRDAPITRPFRAPHHTVSRVGLLGEAMLAHHGVLYLDDLQKFQKSAIDALSIALHDGKATIPYRGQKVTLPTRPLILARVPREGFWTHAGASASTLRRLETWRKALGLGTAVSLQ